MKSLLTRWWDTWRRRRWERAQQREQLDDQRAADHLERQREGIRDVRGGGGASF